MSYITPESGLAGLPRAPRDGNVRSESRTACDCFEPNGPQVMFDRAIYFAHCTHIFFWHFMNMSDAMRYLNTCMYHLSPPTPTPKNLKIYIYDVGVHMDPNVKHIHFTVFQTSTC